MSARVLVIALDAAETSLLEQWSAAGELPAFTTLICEPYFSATI